ncbi:MAG: tetratricopeptide repeat protein [Burkholderiales bacterium]|nr:tetratricopeptide repeat protein [Burkholderiales bacterium]
MSLLMDALKKAERAKTGPSETDAPSGASRDLAAELGLEARAPAPRPTPAPTAPARTPATDLGSSLTLEPLASPTRTEPAGVAERPAVPPPAVPPATPLASSRPAAAPRADRQGPPSTPGADRMTARAVFASKQPRERAISPFHATLAALLLACVVTALYFWWQLRPAAPPSAKPLAAGSIAAPTNASAPDRPAPQTAPAPGQPSANPAPAPAAASATASSDAPVANKPGITAAPSNPVSPPTPAATGPTATPSAPPAIASRAAVPTTDGPGTATARPATGTAKAPVLSGPRPSLPSATAQGGVPVESPAGLRITRNTVQAAVDPAVNAGYAALTEGNDAAAREHYGRALANDRNNRDALYGMATLATRAGRPEEAQTYYRRALELNPRDAFAQAQLTALAGASGQPADESRMRGLIAQQPDAASGAPLSFTLGNRLAAQGRWPEAQQAYFNAYAAEPDNPDYSYNLAVALDQLHQTRQAKTYYERALELSQKRRAGFDAERVRARLTAIAAQP